MTSNLSVDDVRALLLSLLPPGSEQIYDLSDESNLYALFTALAQAAKTYGTDAVDAVRAEVNPSTVVQKIPDWETALGIAGAAQRLKTIDQRRSAVIAKLRESGGVAIPDLQALVQPYLGYLDPTQIVVVETNRAATRTLHTYGSSIAIVIPANTTRVLSIAVGDEPRISLAGAQAIVRVTGFINQLSFKLSNPGSLSKTWPTGYFLPTGAVINEVFGLFGRDSLDDGTNRDHFAGGVINGVWKLEITTGATAVTVHQWGIFVEGIGKYEENGQTHQGLGAEQFYWGILAEPGKLGPNADLLSAHQAIKRVAHSHTVGSLYSMRQFLNPPAAVLPVIGKSFLGVWGSSTSDVWVCGNQGTMIHWNGAALALVSTPVPVTEDIYGLWGTASNNVYAGSTDGQIIKWDGATWTTVYNSPAAVFSISGTAANDIWAVGGTGGLIHHYDGATWSAVAAPVGTRTLWGVRARTTTDAWIAGEQGMILRWDGAAWSKTPSPSNVHLFGTFIVSATSVYFCGAKGNTPTLLHWDGTAVSRVEVPASSGDLQAIWASSDSNVFVGGDTILWNGFGQGFNQIYNNVNLSRIEAIWVDPATGTMWFVGFGNQILISSGSYQYLGAFPDVITTLPDQALPV